MVPSLFMIDTVDRANVQDTSCAGFETAKADAVPVCNYYIFFDCVCHNWCVQTFLFRVLCCLLLGQNDVLPGFS